MKIIPFLAIPIFLTGCVSTFDNSIPFEEINGYMKAKPILSTPKEELLFVNLNCFSDFNHENAYKESVDYSFQGFRSDGIYSENYYQLDQTRQQKEKIDDLEFLTLSDNDIEGVVFEYSLEEDDSGEYVATVNLTKRTFVDNKKLTNKTANVFKHIEYKKDYYPKNKQPIKIYDDKEDICYITASW